MTPDGYQVVDLDDAPPTTRFLITADDLAAQTDALWVLHDHGRAKRAEVLAKVEIVKQILASKEPSCAD